MLDVLGYSDLCAKRSYEEIATVINELVYESLNTPAFVEIEHFADYVGCECPTLKSVQLSDSILIYLVADDTTVPIVLI